MPSSGTAWRGAGPNSHFRAYIGRITLVSSCPRLGSWAPASWLIGSMSSLRNPEVIVGRVGGFKDLVRGAARGWSHACAGVQALDDSNIAEFTGAAGGVHIQLQPVNG